MLNDEQLVRQIRDRLDHPATVKELLGALHIPREERASFKRRLRALVAAGALVEIRGQRYGLPDRMNLVVGRVSTNPRGFGFVDVESPIDGAPASIYIAGSNLNQAVHGDRVVVRVEHLGGDGRAEGRIVRILERGTNATRRAAASWCPSTAASRWTSRCRGARRATPRRARW